MDEPHLGYTWKDMPGQSKDMKRMNFALFRKGHISLEYVQATPQKRKRMNMKNDYQLKREARAMKAI